MWGKLPTCPTSRCVPSFGKVHSKCWNDAFQALEWCIPSAGMVRSKRWNADYQALEVRLSSTCTGFDLLKRVHPEREPGAHSRMGGKEGMKVG
jgi:hypothetical protein